MSAAPTSGSLSAAEGVGARGLLARVHHLSIAEFAFVMATGIISTALWEVGAHLLSRLLLAVAGVAYVVVCLVHAVRVARWPREVAAEVSGERGFTYLTFTAASNVLSVRLGLGGHPGAAALLFAVGLLSWLLLGYGVPLGMIARVRRHTNLDPVNGTWFIWVVGTQSVSVAAAALAAEQHHHALVVLAAACWAIGLVQYLLLAGLELARLLLGRISPRESIAPFWVFMGSAAITVLAGARLLEPGQTERLVPPDLVRGLSMILWSFATWLIPLLLALGIVRTVRRHAHVQYRTEWWAIVFPVGMYGDASRALGGTSGESWLTTLGVWGAWIALGVWVVVLAMLAARRPSVGVGDAAAAGGGGLSRR